MYIILENGTPKEYSLENLRKDNPEVSFPIDISSSLLAEYNVYEVVNDKKPNVDELTEFAKLTGFYQNSAGDWCADYKITRLSEEIAAQNVRNERNARLKETDWMVLPDSPFNTREVKRYRRFLRYVPQQKGFPFDVSWPELEQPISYK
jgi:hypothetical protein